MYMHIPCMYTYIQYTDAKNTTLQKCKLSRILFAVKNPKFFAIFEITNRPF